MRCFRDIMVDDHNILCWSGLVVPVSFFSKIADDYDDYYYTHYQDNVPYNRGAFRIEINFPAEYPFKPPKITFKTKIYHPNIDEKGQICLPIIQPENWKPATRTEQGKQNIYKIEQFLC